MGRRAAWLIGAWLLASSAQAGDVEIRHFTIFVDGKECGRSRVSIDQENDGSATVQATASVEVKLLGDFAKYTWEVQAEERWKAGQLVGLASTSKERKDQTRVDVIGQPGQLQLRVNDQPRPLAPEPWTTSFWKLADAKFHNKQINLLEVDTGRTFATQLQFVGTEKLSLNGKLTECYRFRVTAPSVTDLWFDQYHRLVRQQFVERGKTTIVQLSAIERK